LSLLCCITCKSMMMQVIWDLSCQDLNGARMPFAMSCNLKLNFHKAKGTEDRRGGEGGDHRSTVWDRTGWSILE
jgi:hypothetical protein